MRKIAWDACVKSHAFYARDLNGPIILNNVCTILNNVCFIYFLTHALIACDYLQQKKIAKHPVSECIHESTSSSGHPCMQLFAFLNGMPLNALFKPVVNVKPQSWGLGYRHRGSEGRWFDTRLHQLIRLWTS